MGVLDGKAAIVTGSARGIGRATAELLAEQGARVLINDLDNGVAHKMTDDQFQAMLDIHTVVPFRILRAAAPYLREPAKQEKEEGREVFRKVVNISSISGTMGNAGQVNYSAGKAAVVGLTKTLAKEWGQFKINVNAVPFAFVETRLTAA